MVSELLLNRGEAYEVLGEHDQAIEWSALARDFSAEHGIHQVTFKAEARLESLQSAEPADVDTANERTPATLEGVTGVRDGLSVLRRELAPV